MLQDVNRLEEGRPVINQLVMLVEYDGTAYAGFQLQKDVPTIQGELEKAQQRLTGQFSRIYGSSRTDSGVHALGQVVTFMTSSQLETRCFVHGLNYYLPDDIAVKQAFRVLPGFDVRRKALSREYHYNIINCATRSPLKKGFYAQVKQELDAEAMNEACRHLIGKRDFSSFAALTGPTGSTWRNIIQAEIIREGDIVVFRIKANAFLTHQVRNTAGPLIRVGLGQMTGHEFKGIIEARKRGLAQPTAPAKGLVLYKVNYARELKEESLE